MLIDINCLEPLLLSLKRLLYFKNALWSYNLPMVLLHKCLYYLNFISIIFYILAISNNEHFILN